MSRASTAGKGLVTAGPFFGAEQLPLYSLPWRYVPLSSMMAPPPPPRWMPRDAGLEALALPPPCRRLAWPPLGGGLLAHGHLRVSPFSCALSTYPRRLANTKSHHVPRPLVPSSLHPSYHVSPTHPPAPTAPHTPRVRHNDDRAVDLRHGRARYRRPRTPPPPPPRLLPHPPALLAPPPPPPPASQRRPPLA